MTLDKLTDLIIEIVDNDFYYILALVYLALMSFGLGMLIAGVLLIFA